jgi:hypothetical protein
MSPAIGDDPREAVQSESAYTEDDLGAIFADGQVVQHDFTIRNAMDRPVRLLNGEALTPCCSSIGSLPGSIPPAGTAKIPAAWRIGRQSGARRVEFVVNTDDPSRPTRMLAMRASLTSAWEVEPAELKMILRPGQSGEQRFRVTALRKGPLGRPLPEELSATAPLVAAYLEPPSERTGEDGVVQSSRAALVKVPADREPGVRCGSLLFRWRDGRSETHLVTWDVRSLVSVTPPGLVLRSRAEPYQQVFVLSSRERPIRVIGVAGPLVAGSVGLPQGARATQVVRLAIDTRRTHEERPSEITFHTDHPGQPDALVTVLVIRGPGGQDHEPRQRPSGVHPH